MILYFHSRESMIYYLDVETRSRVSLGDRWYDSTRFLQIYFANRTRFARFRVGLCPLGNTSEFAVQIFSMKS